jgi:hypothetical protein
MPSFEREHQAAIPGAMELDLRLGAGRIALPAPCAAVIGHLEFVAATVAAIGHVHGLMIAIT